MGRYKSMAAKMASLFRKANALWSTVSAGICVSAISGRGCKGEGAWCVDQTRKSRIDREKKKKTETRKFAGQHVDEDDR